tara:strand:- start:635 stop:970 length:336 start_codon:yes stop_codon:yes gene_type:complete
MSGTRITVTLPDDVYDALVEEAELERRKLSDLVRDAVTQMLAGERWQNIGQVAEDAIRKGATNDEALAKVRAKFPQAKTSPASIAWYRSNLRNQDSKVLTDAQARRVSEAD